MIKLVTIICLIFSSFHLHAHNPWANLKSPVKNYKKFREILGQTERGSPELYVTAETLFGAIEHNQDFAGKMPVNALTLRHLNHATIVLRHNPDLAEGMMEIKNVCFDIYIKGKGAMRTIAVKNGLINAINEFALDAIDFRVNGYPENQAPSEYSCEDILAEISKGAGSLAPLEIELNANSLFIVNLTSCAKLTFICENWPTHKDDFWSTENSDSPKLLFLNAEIAS